METKEMLQYIDHTLLKPVCTWDEIETLCKEALSYHTASVCIPPSYVRRARKLLDRNFPSVPSSAFLLATILQRPKSAKPGSLSGTGRTNWTW